MHKKEERDFELFIVDTFVSIYKVKSYTAEFKSGHDLQHNSLHWDATMRAFEIIGESLNYLLGDEKFENLSPSYFQKIVNFRNVIAHGYDPRKQLWVLLRLKTLCVDGHELLCGIISKRGGVIWWYDYRLTKTKQNFF